MMKNSSEKICLAQNLIRLRKARGMMQEQLAAELYVSGKTVSKWERGLRSLHQAAGGDRAGARLP